MSGMSVHTKCKYCIIKDVKEGLFPLSSMIILTKNIQDKSYLEIFHYYLENKDFPTQASMCLYKCLFLVILKLHQSFTW